MLMNPSSYIPKRCVFEATLACNLRCKHCGSRAGVKRHNELSTDEVRDMFGQLAALGCERVTIAGGEPTARPDWPEVIEAAVKAGIRTGMLTNGISFDDEAAAMAKGKGLHAVGFSVDGMAAVHDRIRGKVGHFNRLVQAMAAARRVGLPISIVSFVNSLNIGRLKEIHDFIAEQGAFAWQIQIGTDMGNLHDNPDLLVKPRQLHGMQEEIAELIRHRKMRIDVADSIGYFGPREKTLRSSVGGAPFSGCQAGIRVIGIESNGNVKGCLSIMAGYNEKGAEFVEGNLRESSLADIWFRPGAFAYNREWSIDDLQGFCRECRHVKRCRGGCRGKMVASGQGVDNTMCVYRVACEEGEGRRAGQVAAMALASVLGGTVTACADADPVPIDRDASVLDSENADGGQDGDTDTTTEMSTDDSDTFIPPYGMPEYAMPQDTDTAAMDSETLIVPYGMPEYAMPQDTDTLTKDTDEAVTVYGMADYAMPMDTEKPKETDDVTPPYGMPIDTDVQVDTGVDVYGMPVYAMQEK